MNFIKGRNPFNWLFKKNSQYFLAFIIPFMTLMIAYFCFGVYPISNRSVLSLDLNAQYANYFDYIYDVLAGNESIFYSWSRNLSGEFMGVVGYYLASPFNFLVWIFPREHLTEGLLLMILTKVGSIGLCMSIFLYKSRGLSKATSVIFSSMYALQSYTITQTMNPMWLDGVMFLPLVIFGIEALIDKGKFRLLTASLIYVFVSNFYIGFMIAIFSLFYFIYYFFASDRFKRITIRKTVNKVLLFAASGIVAAMCSAFMLIPVFNSLGLGKFEFSKPDYTFKPNFSLIELVDKLLPNSYDTVRMSGLPFIYCGILTVIMAACYFLGAGKTTRRKRIAGMFLLFVMVICLYIRPIDMLWHGGQFPNWLPYRYSFIISFLLVTWGAVAFQKLAVIPRKTIGIVSAIFLGLMVFLENMDNVNPELKNGSGRDTLDGITVILPAIFILLMITAVVIQYKNKINLKKGALITIAVLVCGEMFYNTLTSLVKQHIDITYSTRDSYVDVLEPVREAVNSIKENDKSFYRMEKNFFRSSNDEIALGMYGLSHSSSTMNSKAINFLEKLGITSHSHNTRYSGSTPLVDDLFGVKYILSSPNNETGKIKSSADITVEENLDALPIAYLVDNGLKNLNLELLQDGEDKNNIFTPQSKILAYMVGKHSLPEYFKVMDTNKMTLDVENVSRGMAGSENSYKIITANKNAHIKYTLTSEQTGELFLWLPTNYQRRVNIWLSRTADENMVDEIFIGSFFEADNYCIKSLGEFNQGDTFSVKLALTKDELYFRDAFFVYMDGAVYNEDYNKLREMNENTSVEKISSTHLRIKTNQDESRLLFTTIPSEPGWTVTVNGVKTDYTEVLGSLIAIPLRAGNNTVEMKFVTNGYPAALIITAGGVLFFVMMCVCYRFYRKYRQPEIDYDQYNIDGDDEDEPEYNEEKLIREIVSDINEINNGLEETDKLDDFDEYEEYKEFVERLDNPNADLVFQNKEKEQITPHDNRINSALDLFPDDAIAKLDDDNGTSNMSIDSKE